MSEQRDFVDFNNGGDTGQDNLDSIQPLTDGEGATQVVLRRPAENIRGRTEILRDEITELKHYRDYGQMLMEYPSGTNLVAYPVGTVLWGGPTSFTGPNNTGIITASGELRISPFLAPKTGKKGSLVTGDAGLDQMTYTVANTFYATQGMNAITVEHRNGGAGTVLSASISDGPVKRILVLFNSANTAHDAVSVKAVVDAAIAADTDLVGAITITTNAALLDTIDVLAETRIEGTADDELHTVTGANLASFSLDVGDGIAIWYRYLVEPAAGYGSDPKAGLRGGRAESSGSRLTSAIPSGSLFKTSASASKIPGAIPICRVAYNGQLVFADGTKVQPGETITFASATSVASAALTSHIGNLATTNGAGLVGYNGSGNWADGVQAIASGVTVETAIDEIVSDLAATTAPAGALHIGVDAGTIFSGALTATGGGGGQSTDTTTRAALDRLDSSVVARRAFTAVCTDNSTSVGGDINTADFVPAINTLAATGGTYLLRRGAYNVSADLTTNTNTHLLGEDVTKVTFTITKSGQVNFFGSTLNDQFSFENIFLKGHASNTYQYTFAGGEYTLRNCRATAGALTFGPSASTRIDINGLVIDDDTQASGVFASITFYRNAPDTNAVTGTIRRLRVSTVPSGSNTSIEKYGLWLNNIGTKAASRNYEPLVFEDAIFDISAGFGNVGASDGAVAYFNASHQPQVYRDCVFRCSQSNPSITPIVMQIVNSTNISFENCQFIQDGYGAVLSVSGSSNNIRFRGCKFYTSTVAVNYPEIGVVCDEALSTDPGQNIVFEDCYAEIRFGTATGSTTTRRIEIGTVASVATGDGSFTIDGLHINLNYSNVSVLADYTVSISVGAGTQSVVEARNITFDLQGKRLAGANTRAMYLGGFGGANFEVDGLHLKNVTEPDTTAGATTLTCSLVELGRGRISGGSINGTPAVSNVSAWYAHINLAGSGGSVEGMRFYETSTANKGRLIRADERCKVIGNSALTSLATGEDTPGWFCWSNSDGVVVNDNTVVLSGTAQGYLTATDDHALVYLGASSDVCSVLGNNIRVISAMVRGITVEGKRNTVVSNGLRCNSTSAETMLLLTTTAQGNVVTANTMINDGSGGTATVTDNGTSTTVPNRVFANTNDISVPATVRVLSTLNGTPGTGWSSGGTNSVSSSNNAPYYFPLNDFLTNGSVITLIRAGVDPAAGSTVSPSTDRLQIALFVSDGLNNLVSLSGPYDDGTSVVAHYLTTPTLSIPVDKTANTYVAVVYGSITTGDDLYCLEVTYTTPKFYMD